MARCYCSFLDLALDFPLRLERCWQCWQSRLRHSNYAVCPNYNPTRLWTHLAWCNRRRQVLPSSRLVPSFTHQCLDWSCHSSLLPAWTSLGWFDHIGVLQRISSKIVQVRRPTFQQNYGQFSIYFLEMLWLILLWMFSLQSTVDWPFLLF